VEVGGFLDSSAVEAEPDPDHPLRDCDRLVCPVVEPFHGEQETGEAPDGEEGEGEEIGHHRPQRDEEHVLRHEIEGETGDEDRSADRQDVESRAGEEDGLPFAGDGQGLKTQDQVDDVDEGEADVEKRPEILAVDLPTVLEDGCELIKSPAGSVDVEHQLEGRIARDEALFALAEDQDIQN
jgi:hypothetical protein